jgi:hypothetical protein
MSCRSPVAILVILGSFSLLAAHVARAENKSVDLPLQRVVLFSSGVGYFEHGGTVEGNAQAELRFRAEDINDLLKSMVVEDLGGGQISTVDYGSKDPISKTLGSFSVDLTKNPTLADLLVQIRGDRVELEAPNKITGQIVGVEQKTRKLASDEVIQVDVLTLLTDEGLRSVPLDTVSRIQLLNEKLNAELHKALGLLASSHDSDKKTVTLQFHGEGKRQVRVGYIQQTPIWKTSYRLVLDEKKAPFLQGWAIVENTSETDWSNVNLTLVSGRPISFTMDLYQPLYVPRPEEQLELYASLRPQRYGQDLAKVRELLSELLAEDRPGESTPPAEAGAWADAANEMVANAPAKPGYAGRVRNLGIDRLSLARGVKARATGGEVGELFQYDIAMPVTLPRQQSAMLPIVNQEVKGDKVSIYDQNVQPKHPLNGLQLTNSTKLHLMQGPITVFDGGVYAGDAIINDLPPGGQRLASYALDLETEVAPETKGETGQLVSLQLLKGTAIVSQKQMRTVQYTIKNSGTRPKTVLIEYPLRAEWTLVQPKQPAEKTRDKYRFAVAAKPGEPSKLTVQEEHLQQQQIVLTNLDDQAMQYYLSAPVVSEKVKKALREIVQQKQQLQQATDQRSQLEQQIQAITQEQTRIRENMDRLDRTSDLYKRYVKKFSDQEDQVEKLRGQIQELLTKEQGLRKTLDEYLANLNVE